MDSTVIVALPSVDDKVYRISSEKVPHLTLCFLGETSKLEQLQEIVEFAQHAASQLSPFGLEVDYRDTLGLEDADVLFFKKDGWSFPRISSFRSHLLKNDAIARAYASVEQFPEWTPHLTLGYPASPAHEDESDYPGLHYVQFDRIAVWTGNYEGPEFRLKYDDHAVESVGAWSDMSTSDLGQRAVEELFHYGVKGMRWGVTSKDRAAQRTPTDVKVSQPKPGKFAKSEGGKNQPIHDDSIKSLTARQKAKSSTTDALSNAELRTAVERMQLEQRYAQLEFQNDRRSRGARFVAGLFGSPRYAGKDLKFEDVDEKTGGQVRDALKKVAEERQKANSASK